LHIKLAQWEQAIENGATRRRRGSPATIGAAWRRGCSPTSPPPTPGPARDGEAKETIERLRILDPHFTALTYQTIIDTHTNPTYQAQTARALEGMRKAGLPEE
jgi:hypothetical protein